ncbi:MAG: phospholipase D-like domain-containing protein [Spirochaetota bacterium]|nr:phospholipase D-like domain-containing protein [Spirochaetota bacterium]
MKDKILFLSKLLFIFLLGTNATFTTSSCSKDSFMLNSSTQTDTETDSGNSSNYPKINLKQGTYNIPNGGYFDFGCLQIGNSRDVVFTIENTGNVDLILNDDPPVSIDRIADFAITNEIFSPIAPGKSASFTIQFSPSDTYNKSAKVTIHSNDPNEETFNFSITGSVEFSTVINISQNITIYFTDPPNDTELDDVLIERINNQSADDYLDICFYGLNREDVITAVESAIARGVHVRFVGNKDGNHRVSSENGDYYDAYNRIAEALDTAFPIAEKKRIDFPDSSGFNDFILINNSIMHNKFALFTDISGRKYLYTGTTNCTDTGFIRNNNNSLIISDNGIVETYKEQFEYLLGLTGKTPVDSVKHHIIDGIKFDVLFSPNIQDGKTSMEYITDCVELANSSIYFMIFSFSHIDLINSLIEKFEHNIDIKGVFDKSQMYYSSEEILVHSGIPCRIDGNNYVEYGHGGKQHQKTMILDHSHEDAVVITGSFNWSENANLYNDENILIIHSKKVATVYKEEWNRRWEEGIDIQSFSSEDNDAEYLEIIMNEIMWMGSRKEFDTTVYSDEFIELKNLTDRTISLHGWVIGGAATGGNPLVLENCSIDPFSYLVILGKDLSTSAFQPDKFIVNKSLSISNDKIKLILLDPDGTVIDNAGDGSNGNNFAGFNGSGDGSLKKSMARAEILGDGRDRENWFTTSTQKNISSTYNYLDYNLATPGSDNKSGDHIYQNLDIVFSEIAWAGTDYSYYDEWIELYNNTDNDINLNGWTIGGDLNIHLTGIIPAGRRFLLERTDDHSVPNKAADFIYTGGLNNEGAIITIFYNNKEIDKVDGWSAGSNSPKISMERIDLNSSASAENWQDGIGDIEGAQNSTD